MALSRAMTFPLAVDDANRAFEIFGHKDDLSKNTAGSLSDPSSSIRDDNMI